MAWHGKNTRESSSYGDAPHRFSNSEVEATEALEGHTRVVLRHGSQTLWGLRISPLMILEQIAPVSDART
ncbi:hypothetical protein E2I00_002506 [Balaenoptera physalus]|uniref:Uncharacterized protein n=1 Tax=Balaenoptera physalus TaxID=9770 RepID=A0A643BNY1_BALPH|nr:hypothetical protein E2I00_002506 [Balaenoptera physalus]